MDIRTSQDVAIIGCCDCQPEACDTPRKECQSITVAACGYSLPDLSTVPAEDRCKIFRKKESKLVFSESTSGESGGDTITFTNNGTRIVNHQSDYITVGEGEEATRECTTRWFSDSAVEVGVTVNNFEDEEVDDITTTTTFTSSSSIGVPCEGSTTAVSTGIPDDTYETDICGLIEEQTPLESWTYTTLGIFSTTDTFDIEGGSRTETYYVSYLEQVTIASLDAEIEVRKTMLDGDDWPDSACSSAVEFTYGYEDPPEIPDPPPDPPDPVPELAIVCEQVSAVTKARYRLGIPAGERWDATTAEWIAWDAADPETRGDEPLETTLDVAHAAWVIAHAEWTAADPDDRGDEPIEPTKRTTYEVQVDEAFFPAEWTEWRALQDAFDAATAAHEIWEAADPDERGEEPEIPDEPGAEPSGPTLTDSRSWIYNGTDEWSEWFEIAVPEEAGETRLVNMLVICYRSASLGQKPTAHGEVYEF